MSDQLWGYHTRYVKYSPKASDLFEQLIESCRTSFTNEYSHVFEDIHRYSLMKGSRYYDNSNIFWALQSQVSEVEFLSSPKESIIKLLLGACSSDYYYRYEKKWD